MKPTRPSRAALRQLWRDAQAAKKQFIKQVDDLEEAFRQRHKLKPQDARIIWLDELLIGIEVRQKHTKQVLYDTDL